MLRNLFLSLVLLAVLVGCGKDEETPEESTAVVEDLGDEDVVLEDDQEGGESDTNYDYGSSSPVTAPRLSSIEIVALSEDLRDGFKAKPKTTQTDESIRFRYEWKHNGQDLYDDNEDVLEWRDEFARGDSITVIVTPYDSTSEGVWSAEGTITIPNAPPRITSEPDTSFEEGKFTYKVKAEDPDGDSIDYSIRNSPAGMTIEPATGVITWEYDAEDKGDYAVTIIVTDSEGAQTSQELKMTIPDETEAE